MKKVLIAVLVIIVALVACYYAFPEKVAGYMMDAARSKAGLTKKEIKIDDHNIVYLEGGKGPTILLLHGYTVSKDNWLMFAPYLTKDYHVVIPDIPGYGESSMIEKDSYDLSNQMSRLHKFVQALELKKFHIAGNSMGGLFAGTYAVRYPDEIISVGLIDAGGVTSLRTSLVHKLAEKGENPLLLKDSNDVPRLVALLCVKEPSLPYPIKKVMIKTALANRQFYEKEGKEIFPDFNFKKSDKIFSSSFSVIPGLIFFKTKSKARSEILQAFLKFSISESFLINFFTILRLGLVFSLSQWKEQL